MPENRYYLPMPFKKGDEISLREEELQHARVLRIKESSCIELVNGNGEIAKAQVQTLFRSSLTAAITYVEKKTKPTTQIILAQALPRSNRMDFILEKGTELGVTEFWFFPSENSEQKTPSPNKVERWKKLTISAMKQCGRLYLPPINLYQSLQNLPKFFGESYFGDTRKEAPLLINEKKSNNSLIYIGPESGFSKKEVAYLDKRSKGVKLHDNILRTDTSSLCALCLLYFLCK